MCGLSADIEILYFITLERLTHQAYSLQSVQFLRYGRRALVEARLEDDAEDSGGEVWDQRELVEEPAPHEETAITLKSSSPSLHSLFPPAVSHCLQNDTQPGATSDHCVQQK